MAGEMGISEKDNLDIFSQNNHFAYKIVESGVDTNESTGKESVDSLLPTE
jgi:hypothetical protein